MWRFVQLSDPHLASDYDGVWNSRVVCTMMPEVMACLRRDLAALRPDFLLVTGDIASTQTREAMLESAMALNSLGIPYYPMGGNHDFVLTDSRQWFLEAFDQQLPDGRTYYAFTHRNLRFLVLDPWWMWADGTLSPVSETSVAEHLDITPGGARWAVPPNQLAWLEEQLRAAPNVATVVATHYPVVPMPWRMHRADYQDTGCLDNGNMLLELFRRAPQVRAVLSGHNHVNFIEKRGAVHHIVTSALPEYPVEYRVFDVYHDGIEVDTRGLSDPTFARRSFIPGREWTRGETSDRRAVVGLKDWEPITPPEAR